VSTTPTLQLGTPKLLVPVASKPWTGFDVAPDGQRLLAVVPQILGNESPMTVVVNWASGTTQ